MIKCEDICVIEELIKKNMSVVPSEVEMPVEFSSEFYSSSNPDEQDKEVRIDLTMEVGEPDMLDRPFYYRITLAGLFCWDDLPEQETKDELRNGGVQVLFSFIQAYFYNALKKSNINPIVLPQFKGI